MEGWQSGTHRQMERDTISPPPSARQRARRCIPAAPRADISSDQRRLSPLCLNQRETLERASGRASEGAHSLTAGQRQTSNAVSPLFRSHGFRLGFELRPRTELHMTATALYKNPTSISLFFLNSSLFKTFSHRFFFISSSSSSLRREQNFETN